MIRGSYIDCESRRSCSVTEGVSNRERGLSVEAKKIGGLPTFSAEIRLNYCT